MLILGLYEAKDCYWYVDTVTWTRYSNSYQVKADYQDKDSTNLPVGLCPGHDSESVTKFSITNMFYKPPQASFCCQLIPVKKIDG